jgi:hypothetical protein
MKQSPKQQNGRITNGRRRRASIVVVAGTCFEINIIIIRTRRRKRGVLACGRKGTAWNHSKKKKKKREKCGATETFNTIQTTYT